jgi:acetyltransferase-like isoleucine patch superfamily enzyme
MTSDACSASTRGARERYSTLRGRMRYCRDLMRSSIHIKYLLASAISAMLPDYASGLIRGRLYRWAGFTVDPRAWLAGRLYLKSAYGNFYGKLSIGPDCVIAGPITINLDAPVVVGRGVGIGPHVSIFTGSHQVGPGSHRMGRNTTAPVVIEDGAWITMGAVLIPGVTIGRGSVVGAGSVVTKDVPPNTYVAGNPATVVRHLPWGNR